MAAEEWYSMGKHHPDWETQIAPMAPFMDRSHLKTVLEVREWLAALLAQLPSLKQTIDPAAQERDDQITVRDGAKIAVKIYSPVEPPSRGSPLYVSIHGGGFCLGNEPPMEATFCKNLSRELGFMRVDVDYRMAPEHPFPVPVHDCWDAVQWAAKNAAGLKANPSEGFVVGGTSAGGNLAAVVSHLARDERLSPCLTGVLAIIPPTLGENAVPEQYKALYQSREQNKDVFISGKKELDLFFGAYSPDHESGLFSPLIWPTGHEGLPPTYVCVCGADPLRDEGLLYEKVLREDAGVPTKLSAFPGLPHGFWAIFTGMKESRDYHREVMEAVKWMQSLVEPRRQDE